MTTENNKVTWKDGYYRYNSVAQWLLKITGEDCLNLLAGYPDFEIKKDTTKCTFKMGEFAKTSPEIQEATGKDFYNVQMSLWGGMMVIEAVFDGKEFVFKSFFGDGLDGLVLITDEEKQKMFDDCEPIDNMNCPYKIQPENQGKLVWISGPPGAGKSTTAQLLGKNHGFVYYEADCVMNHSNPYIPLDVDNPTMYQMYQKPTKGLSREDFEITTQGEDFYMQLSQDKEPNMDHANAFYKLMSEDVNSERKRIGGDFAVAQAVPFRSLRDVIRKVLGSDLVFVLLVLEKETVADRLAKRHGEGDGAQAMTDICLKLNDSYETKGENEPNTFDVLISKDMCPEDIAKKVLDTIKS